MRIVTSFHQNNRKYMFWPEYSRPHMELRISHGLGYVNCVDSYIWFQKYCYMRIHNLNYFQNNSHCMTANIQGYKENQTNSYTAHTCYFIDHDDVTADSELILDFINYMGRWHNSPLPHVTWYDVTNINIMLDCLTASGHTGNSLGCIIHHCPITFSLLEVL